MIVFLRNRGINKQLEVKVRKYLEYAFKQEALARSNADTLNNILSESLRNKVIREIYGKLLVKDELLSSIFIVELLYETAHLAKELNFSPEDPILLVYNVHNDR